MAFKLELSFTYTASLGGLQEELLELQDSELAQRIRDLQQRAETTWEKHWVCIVYC